MDIFSRTYGLETIGCVILMFLVENKIQTVPMQVIPKFVMQLMQLESQK
jgi:hypothetical protein